MGRKTLAGDVRLVSRAIYHGQPTWEHRHPDYWPENPRGTWHYIKQQHDHDQDHGHDMWVTEHLKWLKGKAINPAYAKMLNIKFGGKKPDINSVRRQLAYEGLLNNNKWSPKLVPPERKSRSEEAITKSLFDEDESYTWEPEGKLKEIIAKVRVRNAKAVQYLKKLYKGKCQISGEQLTFAKKDGALYCEAHHLTPLGNKGADSPYNIIIVSPLIHKMLHYAEVSDIDLSQISADKLYITINEKEYTITWHPKHAKFVESHQETSS